ncbi:hypothetical protein DFH09DRAFT_1084900 [Mycena vulgaris]|nr:hypothetical protein DFH09DRAFT_1084900 [Mycena vulgaris]
MPTHWDTPEASGLRLGLHRHTHQFYWQEFTEQRGGWSEGADGRSATSYRFIAASMPHHRVPPRIDARGVTQREVPPTRLNIARRRIGGQPRISAGSGFVLSKKQMMGVDESQSRSSRHYSATMPLVDLQDHNLLNSCGEEGQEVVFSLQCCSIPFESQTRPAMSFGTFRFPSGWRVRSTRDSYFRRWCMPVNNAPSMRLSVGVGRLLSRVSLVVWNKFGPSSSWIEWRHVHYGGMQMQ